MRKNWTQHPAVDSKIQCPACDEMVDTESVGEHRHNIADLFVQREIIRWEYTW